jgi:hypothetical protein
MLDCLKIINQYLNKQKKPLMPWWHVASLVKIKYLLSTFKIVHTVEDTYDFTKDEVKQEGW